ncbi:MAG: hypothetical protein GY896_22810 [Gammaproteobacteria bacterium]|nr:hypothetical protein [Gammaproteobacteria bacterium]
MAFGKKDEKKQAAEVEEKAVVPVDEKGLSTVALKESEFGALTRSPAEIHAIIQANIGASGITMGNLTRVKIPTSGGTKWNVPSIRGEQLMDEIEGIVIHHKEARAYWKKSIDEGGGGQPPDCSSEDGYNGKGDPGGACAECPFNKWGSEPKAGRGKACKQLRIVYLLPKGRSFLPYLFILPPTSLKPMGNYLVGLAAEALRVNAVRTIFRLEKTKNQGGTEYAQLLPVLSKENPELSKEEQQVTNAYIAAIKPALERRVDLSRDDVGEEENSNG